MLSCTLKRGNNDVKKLKQAIEKLEICGSRKKRTFKVLANAFGSDRKNRAILLEFEDAKMKEHLRQQDVEKKAEKLSNFIKKDLKD